MKSKLVGYGKFLICCLSSFALVSAATPASFAVADADIKPSNDTSPTNTNPLGTFSPQQENIFLLSSENQNIPHRSFSLHACFDKADSENKEILVAAANLPIAQAAIVIAKAIPNPVSTLVYGWGNSYNYLLCANPQQLSWTEDIQIAGKRTKKIAVAGASYLQTAFQVEAVRFDIHNRVRRAYAELAAAHAYADVIEAQRQVAEKLLDISQKRYDAGKAPGSEVLQARLGAMQFDTQRNQAFGRIVQDSAQLALLLGEAPRSQEMIDVDENGLFKLQAQSNDLIPDPERGVPPLNQLLPTGWQQRNDLKAAIQNAYADRKALTLAKAQALPDPVIGLQNLFTTYKRYEYGFFDPAGVLPYLQNIFPDVPQLVPTFNNANPPTSLVNSLYYQSIASGAGQASGQPIPNIAEDKIPNLFGEVITVQHETPIFYQHQGQINQAKATWLQQLKQNDQQRAQIATDIVTAYESLLVARANLEKYKQQILPVAARVALMTRRGYQLGKMDLATTMLAQQQYQQLLSSYFDAVVAYQNAWADMEKAVGVPLNL
jgi:cobalt-zinc-cadmium efflux system outer membrane protein